MSDLYELKISRIFSLIHFFCSKNSIILFLPPVIYIVLNLIEEFDEITSNLFSYFMIYIILFPFFILSILFTSPKCLDVSKNYVSYEINKSLLVLITRGNINRSHYEKHKIYNITEIKYHQTEFEKKFNVGSISFTGAILVTNNDGQIIKEEPSQKEIIRGIKDFNDMIAWIDSYVEKYESDSEKTV